MRNSLFLPLFIVSLSMALGACKKAKPEVTALSKLEGLSFGVSSQSISSWIVSTTTGICPSDVSKIEISFDGSTWTELKTFDSGASLDCGSNGNFQFTIDFNRSELAAQKTALTNGSTVNVFARGYSENSLTQDTVMRLIYTNGATSGSQLYVGAGKAISTDPQYEMAGRISYASGATGLVSGTFELKGMIRSQ